MPQDGELHALAVKYAAENIVEPITLTDFKDCWLACEIDGEGKPIRALGLLCMVLRADFPICRFTDNAAVVKLVQRSNDYLHDVYGARGTSALIHIAADEPEELHCPNHRDWMKAFDLKPADRWAITVK